MITRVSTPRLALRPWRSGDAPELRSLLAANQEHLQGWIPAHISGLGSVAELEARIAGFAQAARELREWRLAMREIATDELLGEISLFPRSAERRVSLDQADRLEVGYWLRAGRSGEGFVTEAVGCALGAAQARTGLALVEIRCDARNAASSNVARRLGFHLRETIAQERADTAEARSELQVWAAQTVFGNRESVLA